MEKELSGYRIINNIITPITDENEISAIDCALDGSLHLNAIHHQLSESLRMLSDRQNPHYRGSIKESISAVESMCCLISAKSNLTLPEALRTIEKRGIIQIHPALRKAFIKLYGWTSDDQGIRHALMEESTLTFGDAKYMLVSCSAFINYLLSKVADTEIELTDMAD